MLRVIGRPRRIMNGNEKSMEKVIRLNRKLGKEWGQ